MSEIVAARPLVTRRAVWLETLTLLLFAALIRIVFFRGALGSDETVYLREGYDLLHGVVNHSSYIGALRYGINAVEALSLWLFGHNVVGADGLFFICSLGEVMLAYWFAYRLWGRRAAIWSGLAMATLPLDVSLAGSLNPDCYLAFVIAGSVVTFYYAEQQNRPLLYLVAGLLAGWVFWIKEAVIVYGVVFVCLALSSRRWRNGYWWFMGGGLFWLALNFIFFGILYGNPLYVLEVLHRKAESAVIGVGVDTSLWTYFSWLFIRPYHTGLLGWLALAGALYGVRRKEPNLRFVLIWAVVLLSIFSAFPISFSPLKFIAKQSNYMEIFVFPLVLLTGWLLGRQRRPIAWIVGGGMIMVGVLLSAMEQQVVRVASVNGAAAAEFADSHPSIPVFGPPSAQRQSALREAVRGSFNQARNVRAEVDLAKLSVGSGKPGDIVAYVIEDPQMKDLPSWQRRYRKDELPRALRHCLKPDGVLHGEALGAGHMVIGWLHSGFSLAPGPIASRLLAVMEPVWRVAPARVYTVTRTCLRYSQEG